MLDLRRARRARRGGPPADVHPALDALTARPVSERLITLLAWLETRHDAPEWWRWVWGPRGEELDVGASEDFPLGELRSVQGDDARLLIVRLPDGLRAAAADCPHRGGDLAAGDLEAGALVCPVHAWAFSLDDGSCAADRSCRLPLYGVREVGGRVRVRTDAR
jgi:nitrite reductase (NADH) small subunit